MISKLKPRRGLSCAIANPLPKVENVTQGIHLLKNMHAEKEKAKLVSLARANSNKGSHAKCSKQPSQHMMQKLPNPEEIIKKLVLNPEEQDAATMKLGKASTASQSALTQKAIVEYGPDMEENLAYGESVISVTNCLRNHAITPYLRAKMVNWMIEVLNIFECEDQTFFVAVGLLDLYFASSTKMLNADDVHLAGIACMFIASKYVDYSPLRMKIVYEKIAHQAFAIESIKAKEREIMRTLRFDVTFPTVYNFVEHFVEMFAYSQKEKLMDKHWNTLGQLSRVCLYYGKLALYEYNLLEYRLGFVFDSRHKNYQKIAHQYWLKH